MSLQAPYVCPRCKQETRDTVYFPHSDDPKGFCCPDEPGVGLCTTCANEFYSLIQRPPVTWFGLCFFTPSHWSNKESILYCNYCQGRVSLSGKPFDEAASFKPQPSAEFLEEAGQDFCKLLGVSLYWTDDYTAPKNGFCNGYHESFVSKGRQAVRDALLPQLNKCKEEIKAKDAELQSLTAENKKLLVIVNAKEAEKQSLFKRLDEIKREQNTVAYEKGARLEFLRGRRQSFAAMESKEAELQGLRKELAEAQDNKAELQSLRAEKGKWLDEQQANSVQRKRKRKFTNKFNKKLKKQYTL